tara:strand:+ start:4146 stop:4922 length:777 start_codon:yes stop_codon:yes gene_type:complete
MAAMIVAGYTRKEMASSLDVSLTTVGREIATLTTLTGARNTQNLPSLLQTTYADKLDALKDDAGEEFVYQALRRRHITTIFTALVFSLVVTGYGMQLLVTAYELWNLKGVSAGFIYTATPLTALLFGVALFLWGGPTERECSYLWVGYMLLDELVLDPIFGHEPGLHMEAWSTVYPEWFFGTLWFLIGFGVIYFRHRQFYVGILLAGETAALSIHVIQALTNIIPPFVYASIMVIGYYFIWVVLATGLCFEFNRTPHK